MDFIKILARLGAFVSTIYISTEFFLFPIYFKEFSSFIEIFLAFGFTFILLLIIPFPLIYYSLLKKKTFSVNSSVGET